LDKKHTVFGQVVGGKETLTAMEQVEVDNKDRPIEEIVIERAQIFVDPFQEVDDQVRDFQVSTLFVRMSSADIYERITIFVFQLAADRAAEIEKQKAEAAELEKKNCVTIGAKVKSFKTGVGKYINPQTSKVK
jgi:peptidyl-prolyl cis-trans isomerase-like protein 2